MVVGSEVDSGYYIVKRQCLFSCVCDKRHGDIQVIIYLIFVGWWC